MQMKGSNLLPLNLARGHRDQGVTGGPISPHAVRLRRPGDHRGMASRYGFLAQAAAHRSDRSIRFKPRRIRP